MVQQIRRIGSNYAMGSTSGIDLLYVLEEQLPTEKKFTTSKLVFAQEMLRFQGLIKTDKANAAKNLYKEAFNSCSYLRDFVNKK
jgi:hypothetical protein